MINKQTYADRCFGLPVEQIREYDELTEEQLLQVYRHFGRHRLTNRGYVYAVRKDGNLVAMRERLRPEWSCKI